MSPRATATTTDEHPKQTSRVVQMTREKAEELLEKNTGNRPVSPANLDMFCQILRNGEWALTHQGIAIDWDGNLIDGQHRLMAIMITGVTAEIRVTTGIDPATFTKIDNGRIRNAADTLAILGVEGGTQLGAALRLYDLYVANEDGTWRSERHLRRNAQIAILAEKYPDMGQHATVARRIRRASGAAPSAMIVLLYLINDHADAQEWVDGVITGANLSVGDARLAFRRAMMNAKLTKRRMTNQEVLALGIKSFNAFVNCETVKVLSWAPRQNFPRI